jgi:hypothetical protein
VIADGEPSVITSSHADLSFCRSARPGLRAVAPTFPALTSLGLRVLALMNGDRNAVWSAATPSVLAKVLAEPESELIGERPTTQPVSW